MNYKTLQFKIKDSSIKNKLVKMANSVNYVWNYCNEVNYDSWKKFKKTYTSYDLNNKTTGCSVLLGIDSQTVQATCEEYAKSCKQRSKVKLAWRSNFKSLGWIPFKGRALKLNGDNLCYYGLNFKIWKSREIDGKIRFGSFNENSKGEWFINLVLEQDINPRIKTGKECGIDLGLKTLITLSDGIEFSRDNITKKYEHKLAKAQKAKKKKLVTSIHNKIKNCRKDWNQKISTLIVREYDKICVGDVSAVKLGKTKMAKSVYDASWYSFKYMLGYKAIKLGVEFKETKEIFSTITCSTCFERSGPRGLSGLKVRDWVCSSCGSHHLRDVNAARNILRFSV